jgi:hypothetical protein
MIAGVRLRLVPAQSDTTLMLGVIFMLPNSNFSARGFPGNAVLDLQACDALCRRGKLTGLEGRVRKVEMSRLLAQEKLKTTSWRTLGNRSVIGASCASEKKILGRVRRKI